MNKLIPRDMPHTHSRTDLKYRIHRYFGKWYLCDTEDWPTKRPWNNQDSYLTANHRICTELHPDRNGYDTFQQAHAAYLSQIS